MPIIMQSADAAIRREEAKDGIWYWVTSYIDEHRVFGVFESLEDAIKEFELRTADL